MAANLLPNPNRYITVNNDDGQSFFSTAAPDLIPVNTDMGGLLQRLGYTTDEPPVQLTNNTDLQAYETALKDLPSLVKPGGGSNVWYFDMPPESESPMHRTVSLDFVILIAGELELTLSNDDTRTIKPGDMVIQRSTIHKWRNTSKTQWARIVAVMSECQPVETKNAGTLGLYFPATEQEASLGGGN